MTYSLDFKNCFLIEEGYESGWNNCLCNFHHRGYALVPVSTLYLFDSIFKQFLKWPRLAAHWRRAFSSIFKNYFHTENELENVWINFDCIAGYLDYILIPVSILYLFYSILKPFLKLPRLFHFLPFSKMVFTLRINLKIFEWILTALLAIVTTFWYPYLFYIYFIRFLNNFLSCHVSSIFLHFQKWFSHWEWTWKRLN